MKCGEPAEHNPAPRYLLSDTRSVPPLLWERLRRAGVHGPVRLLTALSSSEMYPVRDMAANCGRLSRSLCGIRSSDSVSRLCGRSRRAIGAGTSWRGRRRTTDIPSRPAAGRRQGRSAPTPAGQQHERPARQAERPRLPRQRCTEMQPGFKTGQ